MKKILTYTAGSAVTVIALACFCSLWAGCHGRRMQADTSWTGAVKPSKFAGPANPKPGSIKPVPAPLHLLLPKKIRIHPFTGARSFVEGSDITGLDVRIEASDSYGDATKAFGHFRFELYSFLPNSLDPKGGKLITWQIPVMDAKTNLVHWNNINRTYEFKLQWQRGIGSGQQYVLTAVFTSPYTERLFAERVFIAGE